MLRVATALILTLACACGDDGGTVDAAPPDAPVDAEAPDGSAVDRCMTLCTCGTANCPVQFPDLTACMTDCAGLEESVRACRIEHCGYAQTNPGFHCPHAIGDETAPGVPPECIAN
jgi:hypothetical protein